jgi:hypothetical protein
VQHAVHASYGPWNGKVIAVTTGEGHTEPMWWKSQNGNDISATITIPHRTPPAVPIWAAHDLRPVDVFALIYNLSPFEGHSLVAPRLPLPCRWNTAARATPPWPTEAGRPPDPSTLRQILHKYGIETGHIHPQAAGWSAANPPAHGAHTPHIPIPFIFLLAGHDGARAYLDDPASTACGPGALAPAQPLLIARCTGNCRAILICHEDGHLWATVGRDSERRLRPLLFQPTGQQTRTISAEIACAITGNIPFAAEVGRPPS